MKNLWWSIQKCQIYEISKDTWQGSKYACDEDKYFICFKISGKAHFLTWVNWVQKSLSNYCEEYLFQREIRRSMSARVKNKFKTFWLKNGSLASLKFSFSKKLFFSIILKPPLKNCGCSLDQTKDVDQTWRFNNGFIYPERIFKMQGKKCWGTWINFRK